MKLFLIVAIVFSTLVGLAIAADDDTFQGNTVKEPFDATSHGRSSRTTSTQILYHGGPVMNLSNSVYVIYYGTFPATTEPIINDFLVGLSGSMEYGVNATYGTPTANTVAAYLCLYAAQRLANHQPEWVGLL